MLYALVVILAIKLTFVITLPGPIAYDIFINHTTQTIVDRTAPDSKYNISINNTFTSLI